MFGWLKQDPIRKLEKIYHHYLEEAMQLQRKGDIKGYAEKMAQAEEVQKQIDEMKAQS